MTTDNKDNKLSIESSDYAEMRVCQNTKKNSQSPDFPKPGLCYVQKFLYL